MGREKIPTPRVLYLSLHRSLSKFDMGICTQSSGRFILTVLPLVEYSLIGYHFNIFPLLGSCLKGYLPEADLDTVMSSSQEYVWPRCTYVRSLVFERNLSYCVISTI